METLRKLDRKLDPIHLPRWLTIFLALIFILRLPSFFEPHYYGDEMIYLALGQGINKGLVLYRDIHDNKPPLLYFVAALAQNVFWFRAILSFWFIVTTALFWKLTLKLFPKNVNTQMLATIIFGLLGSIPLLEGQISNAEVFMVGPTIAAFLILLNKARITPKRAFAAGLLFSVSALFKIPAAFDTLAVAFLFLLSLKFSKEGFTSLAKKAIPFAVGFLLPIFVSIVWYYLRGGGREYIIAAFLQNVGYLSSFRPDQVADPFLVKNGPVLARGVILLVGLACLYIFRKKLPKTFLIVVAWLLTSLFAITLSERPYPHYLIQALPALSILAAMLVFEKTIAQVYVIFPLVLFAATPVYYHFWYYKSLPYYENSLKFATNQKTKEEYFSYFDTNAMRNHRIGRTVRMLTESKDRIFVWYDAAPIYAISKRVPPTKFVAGYHITDFDTPQNTLARLNESLPKVIVVLPNSPEFPGLQTLLGSHYLQYEEIDGAVIWKKTNFALK